MKHGQYVAMILLFASTGFSGKLLASTCGNEANASDFDREASCKNTFGERATFKFKEEFSWNLIARTPNGNLLWKDASTGNVWIAPLPGRFQLNQGLDVCESLVGNELVIYGAQFGPYLDRMTGVTSMMMPDLKELSLALQHGLFEVLLERPAAGSRLPEAELALTVWTATPRSDITSRTVTLNNGKAGVAPHDRLLNVICLKRF